MTNSARKSESSRKPSSSQKQSTFQDSRMLTSSELQSLKEDMRRSSKEIDDILSKQEPA
jgi:hypothetical protein